jgi:hypothetical protein
MFLLAGKIMASAGKLSGELLFQERKQVYKMTKGTEDGRFMTTFYYYYSVNHQCTGGPQITLILGNWKYHV